MVRRASLPTLQRDESPGVLKRRLSQSGGVDLSPADLTTGFYPAPKITSYDPAKMSTLKAVFAHRHLTVFAGTRPVLVNLLWLVYALVLALVLVYADGPDGSMQPTYLHALRIGDGAVLEFRVLSAFVLGGFVVLVVDAWQTRRGNYSSLVSSAKTFLIHVGSTLPLTQPRAGDSPEQPIDLQVSLCAPAPAACCSILPDTATQSCDVIATLVVHPLPPATALFPSDVACPRHRPPGRDWHAGCYSRSKSPSSTPEA